MKVGLDHVVKFHYELSDTEGNALESSRDGDGLAVLQGHHNVIRGVEDALFNREVGDQFRVTVPPELGYGLRQEGLTKRVSKKHLIGTRKPKTGETLAMRVDGHVRQVKVLKVGGSVLDVDLNHPMAGQTLVFDIEVLEVREAEPEELAHGHAHAAGGQAH